MTQLTMKCDVPQQAHFEVQSDDGIVLKLATEPEELEAAFRLVHDSYLRAGLTTRHPSGLRVTTHQLQETSEVIIAMKDGVVISTVTLIDDGPLRLPIDKVYGLEVDECRRAGMHVAEVSCLADRRESISRSMPMLLRLKRILLQHAAFRGVDRVVIAVHPRHSRYYKRLLGFQQLGEERSYAAVRNQPAVAMFKDLDYPHGPNTETFNQFFAEPCARSQMVREVPRPEEFMHRMWSVATDWLPEQNESFRGS